jgi:hypothetical protein
MEAKDLKTEERDKARIKMLDELLRKDGVDGWEDAVKRVLYKLIEAADYKIDVGEELYTVYELMEFFHGVWMYDLKQGGARF